MQKIELNKYIAILPAVDKVLTGRGFKKIANLRYSIPKFFTSQYEAKQYLLDSTFELSTIVQCEFVKVKVIIEE